MRVGIGYCDIPDSTAAGNQAAKGAIYMSGRNEPCDIALLFCTARHNQQTLREAVSAVLGNTVPIYGGGAVGIITNDYYGYAGDQVGVICIWMDGERFDVLTDDGILESEEDAGFRLGQGLARLNITPTSPVMLLYNAVSRSNTGTMRLMMATWILAGIEKALGFLPTLIGAGIQGDHMCSPTKQYIGEGIGENYAIALVFGENINIDCVVMHGCRPASPYYTVTKAEGPMILEINNKPAIAFMDDLLGSAISPEEYPFFLLFGINHGERWDEYDENKYASRLCLGIDRERGGIIMFEPDMVEGTEFQLMFRSFDLDYMIPKIESLFDRLDGREPIFATYIDCAGRCAGYGGTDIEDALIVQQAVAGRVPMLGIYTGVEIASISGHPRGLDWTGVFCLFSQNMEKTPRPSDTDEETKRKAKLLSDATCLVPQQPSAYAYPSQNVVTNPRPSGAPFEKGTTMESQITLEAAIKLCEQNAAKILSLDSQSIVLRYDLELKRRGFRLISDLAVSLRHTENYKDVFIQVTQRVNSSLNMQKTLVLLSDRHGMFIPTILQGFTVEEHDRLIGRPITLPPELLSPSPVIVTAGNPPDQFADLRTEYNLPFFISSPIILQGNVLALLLTGRMVEQPPYFSRLCNSDMETVHAITELLGSVLVRLRLHDVTIKAETDGLTGLWNRVTFQRMVDDYLEGSKEKKGAFMMIDIDYFKNVNDTYGHIIGDQMLIACANAMRVVLRDSDIIGRQGGDEFAVFCRGIQNGPMAERKAAQIKKAWSDVIPKGSTKHLTASIGISICPNHGVTFAELYSNADAALYKAKERGRDCYVLFS